MSALRKQRLLREALGENGEMPAAGGVLAAGGIVAGLILLVLFVG